jgi:hypothetical protein
VGPSVRSGKEKKRARLSSGLKGVGPAHSAQLGSAWLRGLARPVAQQAGSGLWLGYGSGPTRPYQVGPRSILLSPCL